MEVWSLSSRIKVLYLKIRRKCVVTVTDSAFEGSFYLGGGEGFEQISLQKFKGLKLLDASFRM